ncbi:MAG: hypothetical protein M0036_22390 [Desulfobacteraceae bacterium]|nr:hypothetical protein [Desulfobacteraceae bacterium]
MAAIEIEYRFQIEGEQNHAHKVMLDAKTLQSTDAPPDMLPAWAGLGVKQCPNCPLDIASVPHCPAAVNMVRLVEHFDQLLSYDEVTVVVVTAERLISTTTTVQRAVCSLMGLLMATSGCPLTAFFKPMARFHLPFASMAETIWRATSTYLLSQYFICREGHPPDLIFERLSQTYAQIQIVNHAFAKRLRSACQQDSMVNAIILLDMFAKSMPTAIEESLEEIRHLFVPYLGWADHGEKS